MARPTSSSRPVKPTLVLPGSASFSAVTITSPSAASLPSKPLYSLIGFSPLAWALLINNTAIHDQLLETSVGSRHGFVAGRCLCAYHSGSGST